MATLHVRSVPDDLYVQLQELAQARNRSLGAQVITMLYTAVDQEEELQNQAQILSSIRRRRFVLSKNAKGSLDLLDEDRQR